MKYRFFHTLLASCFLGAYGLACAQDVNTQPNEESYSDSSKRSMRVIAFRSVSNEAGDEPEIIYYEDKGKKMELSIGIGSLSRSMPMPKGETMKFFQEVILPVEGSTEKRSTYRDIGTVDLVSGSRAIILLVIPVDLSKELIRGRAFKDSTSIHPKETARVFNMSTKVAAIRAGSEAMKLPVGETGIIKWKAMAYNSVAYQIAMEGKKEGTWEIIQQAECAASPDMRTFVFISGNMIEGRESITSSTFLDSVGNGDDTP
jgi:hypothetical protein